MAIIVACPRCKQGKLLAQFVNLKNKDRLVGKCMACRVRQGAPSRKRNNRAIATRSDPPTSSLSETFSLLHTQRPVPVDPRCKPPSTDCCSSIDPLPRPHPPPEPQPDPSLKRRIEPHIPCLKLSGDTARDEEMIPSHAIPGTFIVFLAVVVRVPITMSTAPNMAVLGTSKIHQGHLVDDGLVSVGLRDVEPCRDMSMKVNAIPYADAFLSLSIAAATELLLVTIMRVRSLGRRNRDSQNKNEFPIRGALVDKPPIEDEAVIRYIYPGGRVVNGGLTYCVYWRGVASSIDDPVNYPEARHRTCAMCKRMALLLGSYTTACLATDCDSEVKETRALERNQLLRRYSDRDAEPCLLFIQGSGYVDNVVVNTIMAWLRDDQEFGTLGRMGKSLVYSDKKPRFGSESSEWTIPSGYYLMTLVSDEATLPLLKQR
ncbi:hypothetical protein NM208_g13787 [Fusarium decemcellulare]|uniref:Uncharacterized protein n=1 Tax=Fusarium decemcellulare TaxID=57161 RepID=A0ACC1RL37_9HYPO|nr:hypothetical protein NM208_g13787 [Fusarium decemcellulare]